MAIKVTVFKKIVSVFVAVTFLSGIEAQDSDECRIPRKGSGTCIPINECSTMTSFLQSISSGEITLTKDLVHLLKSYQCGFHENVIKVCCPLEMITPNPVIIRFSTDDEQALLDITNHRNLNLLPFDCGLTQVTERISGGSRTFLGEFPWMVLINYFTGNEYKFKCGGTVINERYILTAAHCITNLSNLKPVSVRIGEHNVTSEFDCEDYSDGVVHCAPPVQDIHIEEILPHPEFSPTEFMHDIGLLRLAAPINTTTEYVKPICLPLLESIRNLNFTNTKLTITGWGLTELGKISESLLKVNIPILDRSECQRAYHRSSAKISRLHLCGGKNGQDSCGGDSGGPLQRLDHFNDDARFVQYGVVSFGARTCGRVGVPGVYTRLEHYMDWILDTIRP